MTSTFWVRAGALAALAAAALVTVLAPASASPVQAASELDILLAFDTSGSMTPSIAQAKRDGEAIVAEVKRLVPEANFAVVSFRDYQNPAGEYELLQGFTSDAALVQAALGKLQVRRNTAPNNVPVELQNLVLRRSYSDAALRWRPDSRKIVVLVTDGEPYGAGAAGLPGCRDTRQDPNGLNTASELAAMRAAKRTLIVIRQVTNRTPASLECFESLAQRAHAGGAARNGGAGDLGSTIVNLVERAFAPVSIRADLPIALAGGTSGYTLTLANPNAFEVRVAALSATLPAGFRYRGGSTSGVTRGNPAVAGSTLTWTLNAALRPAARVSLHFVARPAGPFGPKRTIAGARIELAGGAAITGTTPSSLLNVVRQPRRLSLAVRAAGPARKSIRGSAAITSTQRGRSALAFGRLSGRQWLVGAGSGRSLTLRARGYRVLRLGAPTTVQLQVAVTGARGFGSCAAGTRGTLVITDSGRLLANGRVSDSVVLRLGGGCRAANSRWANTAGATASVGAAGS